MVVAEYEQEELVNDSEDVKRIQRSKIRLGDKKKQLYKSENVNLPIKTLYTHAAILLSVSVVKLQEK